jgi:hypothetical protein
MFTCVDKKVGGKRGQWGLGMGNTLSMGLARVAVRFFTQKATIPSKRIFSHS